MVASEYKKAGGGYKGGKGKKQKALKNNHGNSFKNKSSTSSIKKVS
jgi:hypothetical protein